LHVLGAILFGEIHFYRGVKTVSRLARKIHPRLDKKLAAYAAAATTAIGVVGLSTAPSAEAEVVYTQTHIEVNTDTPIDLNGDGTTDFTFGRAGAGSYGSVLFVAAPTGNAFVGKGISAFPLSFGAAITPKDGFGGSSAQLARFSFRSGSFSGGPWAGKINQYMGVKFLVNGQRHLGWIRITVEHLQAHISGYAYETVANKPIKAGDTSGQASEASAAIQPGPTLGMLAVGAPALDLWRRRIAA
jgi:hypothetical protein